MAFLPATATLSYNGFTFNGSTRTRLRSKFIYDSMAERVIAAIRYTLTIETIITAADTSATITQIRQTLSKAGKQLVWTGSGFGDLTINLGGTSEDVMWGPKPQELDYEVIANGTAWRLVYVIEWAVPECANAAFRLNVMEFNFEVGYDIDSRGLTTRTYSGEISIPLTRWQDDNTVGDCVDRLWDQIVPTLPPGFRPVQRSRKVSADSRTLTFTIVHEEMAGHGLPWGCVDASGQHRISSQGGATFQFQGVISASFTLARGRSKLDAWQAFFALLQDRLNVTKQQADGGEAFLTGFDAVDGLYLGGDDVSFEASYFFTSTIAKVLPASGMWRPVPNTDAQQWQTTLNDTVLSPRGFAGMRSLPGDTAIIDLCSGQGNPKISSSLATRQNQDNNVLRNGQLPWIGKPGLQPDTSWVKFRCRLRLENNPGTVRLRTLPTSNTTIDSTLRGFGSVNIGDGSWATRNNPILVPSDGAMFIPPGQPGLLVNNPAGGGQLVNAPAQSTPDPVQSRTQPSYRCSLIGEAFRMGYQVNTEVFRLISVGGVQPVPSGRGVFEEECIGNFNGVPMWYARWVLPYVIPQPPNQGALLLPPNPALHIDEQGNDQWATQSGPTLTTLTTGDLFPPS